MKPPCGIPQVRFEGGLRGTMYCAHCDAEIPADCPAACLPGTEVPDPETCAFIPACPCARPAPVARWMKFFRWAESKFALFAPRAREPTKSRSIPRTISAYAACVGESGEGIRLPEAAEFMRR